ncbi:MAG: response regulator [Pyrinomonadaceae bacterium MAG19_C2-C3]|nr:response regulator [Pyrinomonadaceae bacterium MAG19_C2-C3]
MSIANHIVPGITPAPPLNGASAATGRPTILLVEDDSAMRRYLSVVLQRAGFAIVAAGDGMEAVELAMTHSIDAVVTDGMLPGLDGRELCRYLRQHPATSHVPTVLLSGLTTGIAETRGYVDTFIPKPAAAAEIVHSVKSLLHKAALAA